MRALLSAVFCLAASVAHADEPAVMCKEAAPTSKISVTFKSETALSDLALWVMGFSCKNIVFSPDVAKHATKVSILAPRPMTPKQAMQLFVDAIESTGLVVQQKPDTIVIKLGPNMPKNCPGTAAPIPLTKPSPGGDLGGNPYSPKAEADDGDDVQQALDAGIKKIDDTHYEIKKALVEKVLLNPMAFMKGARVVPAMKDGKPEGLKLYAIRPSSPYARLGLTNGDTLVDVNGMRPTDAEKGLEIYSKLRDAKKLDVGIVRGGKPLTLTYVIK